MNGMAELEDIADGLALWQERKPQTMDDWKEIARRFSEEADEWRSIAEELAETLRAIYTKHQPPYPSWPAEVARVALIRYSNLHKGEHDG